MTMGRAASTLVAFCMFLGVSESAVAEAAPAAAARRPQVYRAPFQSLYGLGFITVEAPCEDRPSPILHLGPDAKTGRLDHSEGWAVAGCVRIAGGLTHVWRLAELPSSMVGRLGTAYLVVDVEGTHLVATGQPLRSGAAGTLTLGASSWTTAGISCVLGRCTSQRMKALPGTAIAILKAPMSSLPRLLDLKIDRGFSIESGTGSIGMEFHGRLRGMVVVPGVGAKAERRAQHAIAWLIR